MTQGKFVTAFGLFAALLVATPALVEAQRGPRVPPAGGAGRVPPDQAAVPSRAQALLHISTAAVRIAECGPSMHTRHTTDLITTLPTTTVLITTGRGRLASASASRSGFGYPYGYACGAYGYPGGYGYRSNT